MSIIKGHKLIRNHNHYKDKVQIQLKRKRMKNEEKMRS